MNLEDTIKTKKNCLHKQMKITKRLDHIGENYERTVTRRKKTYRNA